MMDYYWELCDKLFNSKCKSNHFKSKSHIEESKCDHLVFSLKDLNFD